MTEFNQARPRSPNCDSSDGPAGAGLGISGSVFFRPCLSLGRETAAVVALNRICGASLGLDPVLRALTSAERIIITAALDGSASGAILVLHSSCRMPTTSCVSESLCPYQGPGRGGAEGGAA